MDYIDESKYPKKIREEYTLALQESYQLSLDLVEKCESLTNQRAKDFCLFGLARRNLLVRDCLERFQSFYELQLVENWQFQIPDDILFEKTAFLQVFLIAIAGGLDNLAWIIISEKNLTLNHIEISLSKSKTQKCLHGNLLAAIEKHKNWINHIKSFRDPTAHRIPVYVPPYIQDRTSGHRICSPHYAIDFEDGRLVPLHSQVLSDARGFFEIINAGILD